MELLHVDQEPANDEFKKKWAAYAKAKKLPGADKPLTNDPMEATYIGIYMWKQAVEKAKSTDTDKVIAAMAGQTFKAPSGFTVKMDEKNHHLHKPVFIGEVKADGQFNVVWKTPGPVRPSRGARSSPATTRRRTNRRTARPSRPRSMQVVARQYRARRESAASRVLTAMTTRFTDAHRLAVWNLLLAADRECLMPHFERPAHSIDRALSKSWRQGESDERTAAIAALVAEGDDACPRRLQALANAELQIAGTQVLIVAQTARPLTPFTGERSRPYPSNARKWSSTIACAARSAARSPRSNWFRRTARSPGRGQDALDGGADPERPAAGQEGAGTSKPIPRSRSALDLVQAKLEQSRARQTGTRARSDHDAGRIRCRCDQDAAARRCWRRRPTAVSSSPTPIRHPGAEPARGRVAPRLGRTHRSACSAA